MAIPPEVPSRKERRKQWKAFRKGAGNTQAWRGTWDKLTDIAQHVRETRTEALKDRAK